VGLAPAKHASKEPSSHTTPQLSKAQHIKIKEALSSLWVSWLQTYFNVFPMCSSSFNNKMIPRHTQLHSIKEKLCREGKEF
jgi:hypothetical protein